MARHANKAPCAPLAVAPKICRCARPDRPAEQRFFVFETMHPSRPESRIITGPLWSQIISFVFPLALSGVLQQLFNAADVAIVGRFTGAQGPAAMAAVGACSPIIGLLVTLFIGISLGANVTISTAIGSGDRKTVQRAVHTSLMVALVGGAALAAVSEVFAGPVLRALDVPAEVLPLAITYLRIFLIGMPVILLYNFEAAIFMSAGNTRAPLIVLAVAGALNIVLNLLFVLGLKMSVGGVAIATVLSDGLSAALLLAWLGKTHSAVRFRMAALKIDPRILARILKIGVPAGMQAAVFSLANIIIQSAINTLGTTVMAASSAAFNIEILAYCILNAFSQACTTFVGQNNGAGKIARCRSTMGWCFLEGALCLAASTALILLTGHSLLALFNTDPQVVAIGYTRLLWIFAAYIFTISYEIISGYLRGFGISLLPAILTTIAICGVRIGWVYGIFPRRPDFETIMACYPASLATAAVFMFALLLYVRPAAKRLTELRTAKIAAAAA